MKREIIIAKVMQKLSDQPSKPEKEVIKMILDEKAIQVISAPRTIKTFFERNNYTAPKMVSFLDQLVDAGYNQRSPKHQEAIMLVSKMFHLNYVIKQQSAPKQ